MTTAAALSVAVDAEATSIEYTYVDPSKLVRNLTLLMALREQTLLEINRLGEELMNVGKIPTLNLVLPVAA